MQQSILVTGASGFVGSHVVAALGGDYRVIAASRRAASGLVAVPTTVLPDLSNPIEWRPLIEDVGIVVHLAGIAHTRAADTDRYQRVNTRATAQLAQAVAESRSTKLIFLSSISAQVGRYCNHLVTENDEPRPVGAYGQSKLEAEAAIRTSGARYTILRPVLIGGVGVKGNLAALVRAARSPLPIPCAGLNAKRSLLSIGNLLSAIRLSINDRRSDGATFVVADQQPLSVAEIITALRAAVGRQPGIFRFPSWMISTSLTALNMQHVWDSIGRPLVVETAGLGKLDWHPSFDTHQTLADMMIAAAGGARAANRI